MREMTDIVKPAPCSTAIGGAALFGVCERVVLAVSCGAATAVSAHHKVPYGVLAQLPFNSVPHPPLILLLVPCSSEVRAMRSAAGTIYVRMKTSRVRGAHVGASRHTNTQHGAHDTRETQTNTAHSITLHSSQHTDHSATAHLVHPIYGVETQPEIRCGDIRK
jgi:hypothetical protein